MKQAEAAKDAGNQAFASGNYGDAVKSYSAGIVALDRTPKDASDTTSTAHLKATLLSNRAMCHLKTGQFAEAVNDATAALQCLDDAPKAASTSSEASDTATKLRAKILFRRAKGNFMLHNAGDMMSKVNPTAASASTSSSSSSTLLQDAAKDLLELLNYDPNNSEASQLLRTIRMQHQQTQASKSASNTPVAQTLEAIKTSSNKDQPHHLKVLLGLLDSDLVNASTEVGRLEGVSVLFEVISNSVGTKTAVLAAQCLSSAATYPSFVRSYMSGTEIQQHLLELVEKCCGQENDSSSLASDLVVSILAIYDRILLHLDRDDPNMEAPITGDTKINAPTLVATCQTALTMKSFDKSVIRAVLDVLNVWTSGVDRSSAIRAALGGVQDPLLPPPKSAAEIRSMSPQETAVYRKREYDQKTRDQAWAYERGLYLATHKVGKSHVTGLQALLGVATAYDDHVIRREITVTVGRILAGIESEDKLKELLAPMLNSTGTGGTTGVTIEEVNEDEEKDEQDGSDTKAAPIEVAMEKAIITTALLLSKKDVGAWAMGSGGWDSCFDDLTRMVDSGNARAMCTASEVVSAAATLETAKGILEALITGGYMQALISSDDRDIRSGAASAIAKVGLADKATSSDEAELMALLQGAGDLLEDKGDGSLEKSAAEMDKKGTAKLHHFSSFATSSIERGVEMMTYLVANTVIKEEVAAGFQVPDAPKSILERLVEVSSIPNAGESLSGFGLATIYQHLAVTNLQLRKEMFEGKEVTMEQYDEMQRMGKTEEEKEMMDLERDVDTQEACNERIRKLANAHVPRAIVTLMEGASEHTLEQLVLAMNRMAGEPSVRGIMIQQGALTACIKIEKNEGPNETDTMCKVIRSARHCIAKLLITTNPNLLTSAQRLGSVRPLIQLVRDIKASDLQHFEALLAITNVASSGEDAKNRIVSEKGIAPLHFAMFSDHELVQRAATEAMCNLVPHQAMMEHLSQAENLKLWLAFASDYEERYECARAAAGCLAMATQDESIALELVTLEKFGAHMTSMVESGRLEIMHRSFYIVLNLVTHGGDCKEKVVSEGLAAFCKIYVAKYHDNEGTDNLEFSPEEMALLPVTVELAKKIVSLADET